MTTIIRDTERYKKGMRVAFSGSDTLYPLPPDERIPISSIEDFEKIGTEYPANGNFYLTRDIDASDYEGDYQSPSMTNGRFDGQGHTISNFYQSRTSYSGTNFYMGLFKDLNYSVVKNLNIESFDMTCLIVGAIAATMNGSRLVNCHVNNSNLGYGTYAGGHFALGSLNTIANCNATGNYIKASGAVGLGMLLETSNVINCHASDCEIIGVAGYAGLLGQVDSGGLVEHCSAVDCTLSFWEGQDEDTFQAAGGLVGGILADATVKNCYADCTWGYRVTSGAAYVGCGSLIGVILAGTTVEDCYGVSYGSGNNNKIGLIETVVASTVTDSYWDITVSDQTSSGGGTGRTTTEMQTCSTFSSWDTDDVWSCADGSYPTLREFTGYVEYVDVSDIEIGNVTDFQKIGVEDTHPDYRNYKLTTDLDLNGVSWTPIDLYNGQFNGDGHTLSNLSVDLSTTNGVGLFKRVNAVQGLTVTGFDVRGKSQVGLIAGSGGASTLQISDCTALSSTVTGNYYVGSIAGEGGFSEYCYSNSTVEYEDLGASQHNYFGGINGSGYVYNSGFEGTLDTASASRVGGINGNGIVYYCYALCDVTGIEYVGGIVGHGTDLEDSYHIGEVSGNDKVGGLMGGNYQYRGFQIYRSFHSGDVLGNTNVGPIVGYDYPYTFSDEVGFCYYNEDSQIDGYIHDDPSHSYNGTGLSTAEMTCPSTSFDGFDFDDVWECITSQMPNLLDEVLTAPDPDDSPTDVLLYPVNDGRQFIAFKPPNGNNWWLESVFISFAEALTNNEEVKFIFYEKGDDEYLLQEITEQEEFIQLSLPVQDGDRFVLTVTGELGSEYQGPYYEGYVTYRK